MNSHSFLFLKKSKWDIMVDKRFKKKSMVAPMFLLIMGGFLMPGGYMLSNIVQDTVANEIDTALLEIENQGIPLVGDMVKTLGIPEALRGIRDQGVPTVKDILFQTGGAEVLNQIRDQAIPVVTEMVKQVGVAEVMNRIRETANPIIVEMVKQIGVAEVLKRIKEQAVPFTEVIVNATFLTQVLYSAYLVGEETLSGTGGNCLLNMFFDYVTIDLGLIGGGVTSFSAQLQGAGLPAILGISQRYGSNLEIGSYSLLLILPSPNPDDKLAWGDSDTPGFMQETDLGTGVLEFLDAYDAAVAGGTSAQNALCAEYEALSSSEFWKLGAVANYYRQYWVPVAIPAIVGELQNPSSYVSQQMPQYIGMDTKDIAYAEFLAQWANCSRYPSGMDFHDVVETIPVGTYGLEVASPSGITLPVALALWDEANPLGLTNMDAMETWYDAYTDADARQMILNAFPGLTTPQLNSLLTWLWDGSDSFSQHIVPILLESSEGYNMPIATFADQLFMEQWANGTIMGEVMYDGGLDFGEMIEGLPVGSTGFEVGVPVASGMTIDVVTNLWDAIDEMSFFNMDGMEGWYATNTTGDPMYETLRTHFGLTTTQMDMIIDWLWNGPDSFSQKLVPILIESEEGYDMPIAEFAEVLFQELWANGTIMNEVMYPGGLDFGEIIEGLPLGTTGFEVGVPVPTYIPGSVTAQLWNETNPLALFNMEGMGEWYEANSSDDAYDTLQTAFGLMDTQMDMILAWLWDGPDCFNAKLVPILIASPVGYNMEIDEFALSLLLEQWANGTILGDVMFDGGIDFATIVDLSEPLYGFEVGVPTQSAITYESALMLFDDEDPLSLVNNDGINVWVAAQNSATDKATLADAFDLTVGQVTQILDWLFVRSFREDIVPELLKLAVESGGRGMDINELARAILLEQWVNGTADGRSVYPTGFPLPLGDKIIYGFEIGYQGEGIPVVPTGISLASAKALWDTSTTTSLTTNEGLAKWWVAVEDPTSATATELQVAIGLDDKAMGMVLDWMVDFKTNAMPALAQYQLGLPMDTNALCEIIKMGGLAIGAMSFVTGSVVTKRRRTANKTRAVDLAAFESTGNKKKVSSNYVATEGLRPSSVPVVAAPAQAPVVQTANVSPLSAALTKTTQQAAALKVKVEEIKAGLTEADQIKIREAANAKLAKRSPLPVAPAPTATPAVPPMTAPVKSPIVTPAPVTAQAPAILNAPVLPTVTELVPQQPPTPEEEEFFHQIMHGLKQVMVKVAKKQYIDPLFVSNLLYLLRTRRKKFELVGNARAMKRIDEMYVTVEKLRDQAKSQQQK